MTALADPAVLATVDSQAGRITLNRPDTLNALTLEMVQLIDAALDRFERDDDVATVVIDGAGERALCAGGDIRSIYQAALAGDPSPRTFWDKEYRLDARIARYSKPIVVVMDGIVMGGGVGIAAHASHRVVTERSVVAMPEVGIGFAPDVGGTWLLSRATGQLGTHVALTTERLGAADAIACGLADHFVSVENLPALFVALRSSEADHAVATTASDPPTGRLAASREWIDRCYSADSAEEIVARLRATGDEASKAADEIVSKSPTAIKVALRALQQARGLPSLERCLEMEYRISTTFLDTPDFVEGVRAAVIDKDRSPRWDPARLEEVGDVDRFFAPRFDDLHLPTMETAR
jgi:enoyl-CoA hydratase